MAYSYSAERPSPFPASQQDLIPLSSSTQMSRFTLPAPQSSSSRNTPTDLSKLDIPTHSVTVPIASPENDDNSPPKSTLVQEAQFVEASTRFFFSPRTLCEAISVLTAAIPIFVAPHAGTYERGFYCNDASIMYPYYDGTVKPWVLYLFCLGLPFMIVVIGEACRYHISKTGYANIEVPYRLWRKGPKVPPVIVSLVRIFVLFTYGFLITKSVSDISKYAVGRLRPHFLDVCKPDWDRINAEGGCQNRYITEFHCTTINSTDHKVQYRLRDARLSFLSGHASMSFFCMFFVIFYLESRLRWNHLRYCKAIIQFGLFLLAALTAMSRISDHKVSYFLTLTPLKLINFFVTKQHHWTDVFAGALLGLVMSVITVFVIGDFFYDSRFLRYKLVAMLQKLDWGNDEGVQFAQLIANNSIGKDHRVLKKLKHVSGYRKTY